ncbi:MAG: PEP-CTERM sorting domain-containing protein, partial [Verrucomicrobiota bacterium]
GIFTYNLNGGTLTVPIISHSGASTGRLNFNGGTIIAATNGVTLIGGLTQANVQTNSANINLNGKTISISQALLHDNSITGLDGGLSVTGTGSLTLTGTNSYTGTTSVAGGAKLLVRNNGNLSTAATANVNVSNATLDVSTKTVSISSLTLGDNALVTATTSTTSTLSTGTISIVGNLQSNESLGTNASLAATIAGAAGLSHTGAGDLTVAVQQFYSGVTEITGGRVQLGSASSLAAASGVNVHASGTLAGTGTASGLVTVSSGGNLAPGPLGGTSATSIGVLHAGSAAFQNGGSLTLDITRFPTGGTPGINWDQLAISGALDGSGLGVGQFTLHLKTSDLASFVEPTLVNGFGALAWDNVITAGSVVGGSINANRFAVDASGFANGQSLLGTFSLQFNNNGGFDLIFAVPEPATMALFAGLGAISLAVLRRRNGRKSAK